MLRARPADNLSAFSADSVSLTPPSDPVLHIPFTKMQGAGNDFIVVDNRFFHFTANELAELARRYCPRRFGVGADGLLALDNPPDDGAHYRMRYFNADGSIAGMCGNGARCLARFARSAGLDAEPLIFASDAGTYRAHVPSEDALPIRLEVPSPTDFKPHVRLADGRDVPYIHTGTDHVVLFVDDLEAVDPAATAPAIRQDPAFAPAGTNVNFVEVVSRDRLGIRTYEKGVEGETLACGTGALAAAVVTRLTGRSTASRFEIEAPGGELAVGFDPGEDEIRNLYLEGGADRVFEGILAVDPSALVAL